MSKTFQHWMMSAAAVALLVGGGVAEAKPKKEAPKASAAKTGIGKGDTEFGALLNLTNMEDADLNTLTVGVVFGKFMTDHLELRITPVVSYLSMEGAGMELWNFNLSPYVTLEYQIPTGAPVVPYFGGGIGITVGFGETNSSSGGSTFESDSYTLGAFVTPVAGLKFFVSERTALELAVSYQVGASDTCTDTYVDTGSFSTFSSDCSTNDTETLRQDIRFTMYY